MDERSQIQELKRQFRDWAWLRAARIPPVFHDGVRRDTLRLFRQRLRELKEQDREDIYSVPPSGYRTERVRDGH